MNIFYIYIFYPHFFMNLKNPLFLTIELLSFFSDTRSLSFYIHLPIDISLYIYYIYYVEILQWPHFFYLFIYPMPHLFPIFIGIAFSIYEREKNMFRREKKKIVRAIKIWFIYEPQAKKIKLSNVVLRIGNCIAAIL